MRKSTILLLSVVIGTTGSLRVVAANQGGRMKSLSQAAIDGDVEQIRQHLAKGSNFNEPDSDGYTPLKRVIEGHNVDAAMLIIESGKADLNIKDRDGRTALLVAALNGEQQIGQALVAKGADVKVKDKDDRTALHMAILFGEKDLATVLIEKGADVNAADRSGQTPLTLAQQRNQPDIAELLKSKGAKEPTSALDAYGDYAAGGNQAAAPAPGAAGVPADEEIVVDVNAIREQLKPFEDLAAGLTAVDKKSLAEQQGWFQRRLDNRPILLQALERQINDELAFVKPIATQEKAEKTLKAVDELAAQRKKWTDQIQEQLREQRRSTLTTTREPTVPSGRTGVRGGRGRTVNMSPSMPPSGGYAPTSPYGGAPSRLPPRRGPAEVNQPAPDPEVQQQIDAWLNCKPEDKTALLAAVRRMNLVDFNDLRQVAEKEQAKKTAAAISGLMMIHEERVQKVVKRWQDDDERMLRLQERYGPGRGTTQPGMPPQQVQPSPRGRRGR